MIFYFKLKKTYYKIYQLKQKVSELNEENTATFHRYSSIKKSFNLLSEDIEKLKKKNVIDDKECNNVDLYELSKSL